MRLRRSWQWIRDGDGGGDGGDGTGGGFSRW